MADDTYFYEPSRGHGLAHDPLNSIVAPRPIGWIASRSPDGVPNLAPYSFFNLFNYRPPVIGFASIGYKDTVRNVEATGEFVWNLATRPLAAAMNASSAAVAPDVDEFRLAAVTALPCRLVGAPRVGESPVAFECRLTQLVQLQDRQHAALQTWLVLGEVVGVHIRSALLAGGRYDTAAAEPILRGGGTADYFTVTGASRFRMERPG